MVTITFIFDKILSHRKFLKTIVQIRIFWSLNFCLNRILLYVHNAKIGFNVNIFLDKIHNAVMLLLFESFQFFLIQ
jgi:hypothetical protein